MKEVLVIFVETWRLCVLPLDKSVSEVLDNSVNLWEEGRVEDELSPEEIQMVWHFTYHYTLLLLKYWGVW